MINDTVLNKLNKANIGADIDSLESFIVDFKQASELCDLSYYSNTYNELKGILREAKVNSKALQHKSDLDSIDKSDPYVTIFEEINNVYPEHTYGSRSLAVQNMKASLDCNPDGAADLVAITNVDGLDVLCSYMNGYIYRIYAIGETQIYIDLTEQLKSKVPSYIDGISCYREVELRGKITIFNNHKDCQELSKYIPCSAMRLIRLSSKLDCLDIVFNDMFIKSDNLPYTNQWDKLEYMRDNGISVPHHVLVRNIDKEILSKALLQMHEYFRDIRNSTGMVYKYHGIIVRFNDEIVCNSSGHTIIYNAEDLTSDVEFESTVKSISTTQENNEMIQHVGIVATKCNDDLVIDCIDIDDIYDIEEYEIVIGKKIKFKVIENKAVLC